MMTAPFEIKWHDSGHEPTQKPNPRYPHGIDLDISAGGTETCSTALPYPAKRIGYYAIYCMRCGQLVTVSTAGRADDPRSIRIACKERTDGHTGKPAAPADAGRLRPQR